MSKLPENEEIKQANPFAKYTVLVILFALPLVAYLFFLQGKHNFDTLPVLVEEVGDLDAFKDVQQHSFQLKDSVTIITFLGKAPFTRLGYVSNINEKVYKEFHKFNTFQLISILPSEGMNDIEEIKTQMSETTDIKDWHFVSGTDADIQRFFNNLKTDLNLNKDLSSDFAFIIDKSGSLRGRDDSNPEEPIVYGYDTSSIPALQKVMMDDVRVLLAEYRFAFKKNRDEKIKDDEQE
jgi:hypothetical protein